MQKLECRKGNSLAREVMRKVKKSLNLNCQKNTERKVLENEKQFT